MRGFSLDWFFLDFLGERRHKNSSLVYEDVSFLANAIDSFLAVVYFHLYTVLIAASACLQAVLVFDGLRFEFLDLCAFLAYLHI